MIEATDHDHFFVDEAGDPVLFGKRGKVIVGAEGVSRFFMLGVVHLPEPERARRELDDLRVRLLRDPYFAGVPSMDPAQRKTALYFHAKNDLPEVRREVLNLLPQLKATARVAVRRKSALAAEAVELFRHGRKLHANVIYDELVRWLFHGFLDTNPHPLVAFAKRGKSDRLAALSSAIIHATETERQCSVTVYADQPVQSIGLQVADYYLWVVQRLFERREDRFFNLLAGDFDLIMDLDDRRKSSDGGVVHPGKPNRLEKNNARGGLGSTARLRTHGMEPTFARHGRLESYPAFARESSVLRNIGIASSSSVRSTRRTDRSASSCTNSTASPTRRFGPSRRQRTRGEADAREQPGRIAASLGDLNKIAQKANLLSGIVRNYAPMEDGGEQLPSESKYPQKDVVEILREARQELVALDDAVATQEYGNVLARADVVVDGQVIVAGAPVTVLLFLEKRLNDLHTFVSNLPTLDPSEQWARNDQAGQYELRVPQKSVRTKKVTRPLVLYPATPEHPAQTQLVTEDVAAGTWTTQKFAKAGVVQW